MNLRQLAFLIALGASTGCYAQEDAKYPPLVQDLPDGYNRSAGDPWEILGLHLGQDRDAAITALQAAFPETEPYNGDTYAVGIQDQDGNSASFLYDQKSAVLFYKKDQAGADLQDDDITVYYSPATVGSRVTYIGRKLHFSAGNEVDIQSMLDSLKAKYGEPSVMKTSESDGDISLYYVLYEGVPRTLSEEEAAPLGMIQMGGKRNGEPTRCAAANISYTGTYDFEPERTDAMPSCTAALRIDVHVRQSRVYSVWFDMLDYRRWFDSGVITDKYLIEQVEVAKANRAPGKAAPAL